MFILDASNFKEARITIFLISINVLLYFFFSLAFEDLFYQLVQINSKIFVGNIFSLFLLPFNVISLGASGAIFGLIGATLSLLIVERDIPLIILGLFYVFYFVFSSFSPGINYFAHIFGLLGGFSTGFAFKRKKKSFETY
jgi:rhomboid protease GluP